MASNRDAELREESCSYATQTVAKLGFLKSKTPKLDAKSRGSASDLTASSPAVLESSKDSSRSGDDGSKQNVFKKTVIRSLPKSSSETAPIVSRGQPNECNIEQVDEQIEVQRTCCTTVYNCYKNSVIQFRNSAFIYLVQILFSSIPVSAIVMGTLFIENCPKASFLPAFGAVVGMIGVIVMTLWMVVSCLNRRGTPCSPKQRFSFGASCFVVLLMTAVDAGLVYSLSPSFDPTAEDYCNKTFYTYAFYKHIATAVVVVLSAILYIPGSRHTLCCQHCSMRSPASAFYYSL